MNPSIHSSTPIWKCGKFVKKKSGRKERFRTKRNKKDEEESSILSPYGSLTFPFTPSAQDHFSA
jgi:hypothetical protein